MELAIKFPRSRGKICESPRALAREGKMFPLAWAMREIRDLHIECALRHVTGIQFDKKMCPYKSAILDFLQKLPFAFAQNVLGRANFALINPPFCGDNFLTDTRARILCLIFLWVVVTTKTRIHCKCAIYYVIILRHICAIYYVIKFVFEPQKFFYFCFRDA